MADALSPEIRRLVQQQLNTKGFNSADEVLLAAMNVFTQFQDYYCAQQGARIKTGFDQIARGEGSTINDENELASFFDDIQQRGRERYKKAG